MVGSVTILLKNFTAQCRFYLRITGELAKKWDNAPLRGWSKVLNQLTCLDKTSSRIAAYL